MSALTQPADGVVLQRVIRDQDKILIIFTRALGKVRAIARGSATISRWSGRLEPLVVLNVSFARSRGGTLKLTRANFVESLADAYQSPPAARALAPFLSLMINRFPFDYPEPKVYTNFIYLLRVLPLSRFREDLYWAFSALVLSRLGGLDYPHPLPRLSEVARRGLDPATRRTLKTAVTSGWQTALNLPEPGFPTS